MKVLLSLPQEEQDAQWQTRNVNGNDCPCKGLRSEVFGLPTNDTKVFSKDGIRKALLLNTSENSECLVGYTVYVVSETVVTWACVGAFECYKNSDMN